MRRHAVQKSIVLCLALSAAAVFAADAPVQKKPTGNSKPLTAQQEMATFQIKPGYHVQLVAGDDMLHEPADMVWDADGRMYVIELDTYMQDIDGKNELTPHSRILRLEDTNGDGVMDKRTVFADNLTLPRMVLPLTNGRILISQTNDGKLYSLTDTNGDGVADKTEVFYDGPGLKNSGNLEHQDSGLIWNIDNWIYTAMGSVRFRYTDGKVVTEPVAHQFAQWGLTQDDEGRMFYSTAGGERPAYSFQWPPIYGFGDARDQLTEDFVVPYPIIATPDVQGGPHRIKPDGTLNHFTACCGQTIYRGDALPKDCYGNYFVCEPVGRLVRRATVTNNEGKIVLANAYHESEFLASSDMNFRPVRAATGPDGCLYICDMYRGIIQEGNWVRPGSYLRPQVQKFALQDNIGRGRIYRITHDGIKPGPRPHMYEETPAQLVTHLTATNGWWRIQAQKQLVLRHDLSVVPALENMVRTNDNPIARLQAMWTLEGLDAITKPLVIEKLHDADERVRCGAIRIGERYLAKNDAEFISAVEPLVHDKSPSVAQQLVLSIRRSDVKNMSLSLMSISQAWPYNDAVDLALHYNPNNNGSRPVAHLSKADMKVILKGRDIYTGLCISCHGPDGKGMPVEKGQRLAPPLVGSPYALDNPLRTIRIALNGLSGKVDGKIYLAQMMIPLKENSDDYIAAALSYVRHAWGNEGSMITPQQVAAVRAATKDRNLPYTLAELDGFGPISDKNFKAVANRNQPNVANAWDHKMDTRWSTNEVQHPGETFTLDTGAEQTLAGIRLNTTPSPNDYPDGYQLMLSADGEHWSKPILSGHANASITDLWFPPTKARYIRLIQTGHKNGLYWSIHELEVFGAPSNH